MKEYLKDRIASYNQWRKSVLLIAPFEIVLILVVLGLLVMTVFVSLASTAGKHSINALKQHLQNLQPRLANPGTMDPEAERANMEILFNKVKATCEQPVISRNKELRELFSQTNTKMDAIQEGSASQRGSWIQLKGVTNSFQEQYFPFSIK